MSYVKWLGVMVLSIVNHRQNIRTVLFILGKNYYLSDLKEQRNSLFTFEM
jgi:hypothetical protein